MSQSAILEIKNLLSNTGWPKKVSPYCLITHVFKILPKSLNQEMTESKKINQEANFTDFYLREIMQTAF